MRQLPIPQVASKYWAFRGGLDQVTPSVSIDPGRCINASNVEVGPYGGLAVTRGYERYDGQFSPSDAEYYIIGATFTGTVAVGNTLSGGTSGATGVVIAVTSSTIAVTKLSGSFVSGEALAVGGPTVATATTDSMQGSASTPALNAAYRNLAADVYRADITAVPGSGNVLGIHQYNGNVYAIRNNAGSTAAEMYKDTTGGWSLVNLGRELAFTSGGTTEIAVGNTITGATSGATAVIGTVVVTSGTWSGGTAAGFLYFVSQTGTFQSENLNIGASLNVATIGGNSSAVALTKSGRYEFVSANFGGSAGTLKMFGCSGVHKAFQFDGTNFAYISTGMSNDIPSHIAAHKNQLFLSFGASAQHSAIADPLTWSAVLGAAEIAVGENITNFLSAPGGTTGGAMVIYTRNKTLVLYGNSSADWNLVTFNPDAGALSWTAQYIGQGIALDDRGVTTMATAQEFGNFSAAAISQTVHPFLSAVLSTASASCVVRDKNQYRLFFSGGAALYITFVQGQVAGLMPISLTDSVTCVNSQEAASGSEQVFFGSSNGFVYQMEKGTSHDGAALAWTASLAYNHFGSPLQLKQFRKVAVEASGEGYCEFSLSYNVGYATTDLPQGVSTQVTAQLDSVSWDAPGAVWDQMYWDGQALVPAETYLDGTAENISLVFAGSSDEFEPITLNGAILSYTPRRLTR